MEYIIYVNCPHCGAKLAIFVPSNRDEFQVKRCYRCGIDVRVPFVEPFDPHPKKGELT